MLAASLFSYDLLRAKLSAEHEKFQEIVHDYGQDYPDNLFGFILFLIVRSSRWLGLGLVCFLLFLAPYVGYRVVHNDYLAEQQRVHNLEVIQNNRVTLHDEVMSAGENCVTAKYDIDTCKKACDTFGNYGAAVAMDCKAAVNAKYLSLPRPTVEELKRKH